MANKIETAFAAHKKPILVGGASLATVLGYVSYTRHKAAGSAPVAPNALASGATTATDPTGATISGYTPEGTGSADTTGTDVYNALQPQMAQQQSLLAQLLALINAGAKVPVLPTPSPTKPAPAKPSGPIHPGPTLPVVKHTPAPSGPTHKPAPAKRYYTVSKNDNLTNIGHRFGVSWSQIYAANRSLIGRNPNLIRPGQRLVIP